MTRSPRTAIASCPPSTRLSDGHTFSPVLARIPGLSAGRPYTEGVARSRVCRPGRGDARLGLGPPDGQVCAERAELGPARACASGVRVCGAHDANSGYGPWSTVGARAARNTVAAPDIGPPRICHLWHLDLDCARAFAGGHHQPHD